MIRQCIKCGAVYPFPISRCRFCLGLVLFTDGKIEKKRQTARQLFKEVLDTSIIPGYQFLGALPDAWTMLVSGPAGHGKSTFCLQLSQVLASRRENDKVLYWTFEESFGPSMQVKLRMNGITAENLIFTNSENITEFLKECDEIRPCALVIDSLNDAGLDTKAVKLIKTRLNCIGIFIAHYTKDNKYKGNSSLKHEMDIFVEVKEGEATTQKNRFDSINQKMRVWPEKKSGQNSQENTNDTTGDSGKDITNCSPQ